MTSSPNSNVEAIKQLAKDVHATNEKTGIYNDETVAVHRASPPAKTKLGRLMQARQTSIAREPAMILDDTSDFVMLADGTVAQRHQDRRYYTPLIYEDMSERQLSRIKSLLVGWHGIPYRRVKPAGSPD